MGVITGEQLENYRKSLEWYSYLLLLVSTDTNKYAGPLYEFVKEHEPEAQISGVPLFCSCDVVDGWEIKDDCGYPCAHLVRVSELYDLAPLDITPE